MQKIDAKELLEKYNLGTCTDKEKDIVESWYQKSWVHQSNSLLEEAIDESLDRVWKKLNAETPPVKVTRLWPSRKLGIGVAAAIAFIVLAIYFYTAPRDPEFASKSRLVQNDIAPGKHGGTLTLANGKKIYLTDAKAGDLANESGVNISKNAKGEIVYRIIEGINTTSHAINILETSRGEQTQVWLPDGSTVYLNAASSLKYPASFANQKNRKVALSGEGYFEIAKDKARPFIVESRGQEVKVLGTHFNINAYNNEPSIKTTLLEGRILINTKNATKILTPGFEATNVDNKIAIHQVDPELAVSWKNNLFLFDKEELGNIMRQIERWYNVEVEFRDSIAHEQFGGGVSRFDSVSKVLESLEATGKVHFEIEGRKIYVSK